MTRFADLPPADQAAVKRALAGVTERKRPRPSRRETGGPTSYRCCTDGETFGSWPKAERHSYTHGGGRLEAILPQPEGASNPSLR